MIRRPPRSTPRYSSAASDVYKRQECPFSGVTKSGRVWRKVPESDARSVRCWSATTVLVSPVLAVQYGLPPVLCWGSMVCHHSPLLGQHDLPPQSCVDAVWFATTVLVSPVLRQYGLSPQSWSVLCLGSMVCHHSPDQSSVGAVWCVTTVLISLSLIHI